MEFSWEEPVSSRIPASEPRVVLLCVCNDEVVKNLQAKDKAKDARVPSRVATNTISPQNGAIRLAESAESPLRLRYLGTYTDFSSTAASYNWAKPPSNHKKTN